MRRRHGFLPRLTAAVALAGAVGAAPAAAQVSQTERNALIELFQSTGGLLWTDHTNWLGAEGTECTWYGVTCSASAPYTVLTLNLGNNNLTGTIPAEIGDLGSLQSLALYDNAIGGAIPEQIGNLTGLSYLNLDGNDLTGTIPSTFDNLVHLDSLDLGGNLLSGPLPTVVYRLPALGRLDLAGNAFTGPIGPAIGDLTNLQSLLLSDNDLTGTIPDEIWSLGNLTALDLAGNHLVGPLSSLLGNLGPDFMGLNLGENDLTGPIPTELCSLTGMQYLKLGGNRLDGEIPSCIGQLDQLIALDLAGNALGGFLPQSLGDLTGVRYLLLDGNRFTGQVPASFVHLTDLMTLTLEYNALWSGSFALSQFLQAHDPGWATTQTLAPDGLDDVSRTRCSVVLQWDPVTYDQDPGGYEVWYATDSGGPYTRFAVRSKAKNLTTLRVTGLASMTTYYFAVSTFTDPHPSNRNLVESLPGDPFAATTGVFGEGENTDMDGDPAPSHADIAYLIFYLFDDHPIFSADANCDGKADAADLATLDRLVYP